jgi:hypothetical protein
MYAEKMAELARIGKVTFDTPLEFIDVVTHKEAAER